MSAERQQQELIIEHYKHPHRRGLMEAPDARHQDHNPFCGDEVTIDLKVTDGVVVDAAFDGRGCSISLATASMLMDAVVGKSIAAVNGWDQQFVLDLLGITIGPVRMKCALLPLTVLHGAINGRPDAGARHEGQ